MKSGKKLTSLLLCLVLVLIAFSAIGVASFANTVTPGSLGEIDVYLIAGQSNAVGYGVNYDADGGDAGWVNESIPGSKVGDENYDSRYTEGFSNVLFYGLSENQDFRDEFIPVRIGLGQKPDRVGAEVGIAKAVADTGRNSAVIKYAVGGTPLTPASHSRGTWTSPSYIEARAIDTSSGLIGNLYTSFIDTVKDGVAKLKAQGYTPVLRGVWWMQGCAESNSSWRTEYAACLDYLIKDMRADLGLAFETDASLMPFVAGSIRSNHQVVGETAPKYLPEINQAQLEVQAKTAAMEIVDTSPDGFPEVLTKENIAGLTDKYRQQDGWHFTAKAQHQLGFDFIEKIALIESKNYVSIEAEDGVVTSGVGAYAEGDTVTVEVTALGEFTIDKLTKQVGSAEATVEALTDGKLTFTMPADDVRIKIETTDTNPEVISGLGSIPSYYPAADYPFALFKGDVLYDVYTSWADVLGNGGRLASADGNNTLYLRRDYASTKTSTTTDDTQMLCHVNGKLDFDLGGNTLTRGNCVLFRVMTKDSEGTTEINITNGNILASGGAPFYIATHGNASRNHKFIFNIDGVTFGIAQGASPAAVIAQTGTGNITNTEITSEVEFNLNGCTVDVTGVSSAATLFDIKEDAQDGVTTPRKTSVNLIDTKVEADSLGDVEVVTKDDSDEFYANDASVVEYTEGGSIKTVAINTLVPIETKYGIVSSAWADEWADPTNYPFIIFKNGECVGAEQYWIHWTDGTWQSAVGALCAARLNATSASDVATVLLRRDYDVNSNYNDDQWAAHTLGTVNIDLAGYTITSGPKNAFLQDRSNQANTRSPIYNIYDGTVNIEGGFLIRAYSQHGDYEGKSMQFNFKNVNIGFASGATQGTLIASAAGNTAVSESNTTNISFTDCNFDLVTNAPSSVALINMSASAENHKANIVINGGNIKVTDYNKNFTMASLTAGYDSLKIGKGKDGEYTVIEVNDYKGAPNAALVNTSGEALTCYFSGMKLENGTNTQLFRFFANSEAFSVDGYGLVPNKFKSAEEYPFLVFQGGKFFGADSCWLKTSTGNDVGIYGVMLTVRKGSGMSDVLLRRDYEYEGGYADKYLGHLNGTVNMNLGGYTVTAASRGVSLFRTRPQYNNRFPVYNVSNGTFLVKYSPIIELTTDGKTVTPAQEFALNFEGVKFGYAEGAEALSIMADNTAATHASISNISFKNCEFDALTNAPDGAVVFDIDNTDVNIANITFYGCKLSVSSWDGAIIKSANDTLAYKKYDGTYLAVELPKSVGAPVGTYEGENGNIVFKKIGSTDTTDIYRLVIEAVANLDFTPKASVTLDSNLIFNIYIPKHESLTSATVSEIAGFNLGDYSLTEDGAYYIVPVELAADKAASVLTLAVTLNLDGTLVDGTYTFSTVKYAEKLLSMNSVDATEKTLAKDMLSYIRSAYNYFNAADKATVSEEIDAVLNGYASTAVINTGDAKCTADGLSGATFVLGANPAIRFYLDTYTADKFSFKVGERTLRASEAKTGNDTDGDYIEFTLYAYEMTEVFSYTVKDTAVAGEYNLIAYYADAVEKSDTDLAEIVAKFYNYCLSAKAYRNSIISE